MLDHSGVVRVVNVEPLPDGKTGYDLRILPEARALPASGPARTPEAVQLVARVADLLVQGKSAGMVLREVTVDSAPIAAGRAEVASPNRAGASPSSSCLSAKPIRPSGSVVAPAMVTTSGNSIAASNLALRVSSTVPPRDGTGSVCWSLRRSPRSSVTD